MIQLNDVVAVVKFILLTSTIVSSVFVAIMASVSSDLDGSGLGLDLRITPR